MIFPWQSSVPATYPEKEVLSAREVAELLGVNVKRVYEAAAVGELPCRRIGRKRLLFSRRAVMAWLECKPA